jgi:dolichyl-phosphate beta-glucosyltransferase
MQHEQTKADISVSVIIPCYNELPNLHDGSLDRTVWCLSECCHDWEIIVVDDGSTISSVDQSERLYREDKRVRFIRRKHRGKHFALRSGIELATKQYCLIKDMDDSVPVGEIENMISRASPGVLITGKRIGRFTCGSHIRTTGSFIFHLLRRMFFLHDIADTQCGFKLLSTEHAKRIFASMHIFSVHPAGNRWTVSAFDVELLYLARMNGLKISEQSVPWFPNSNKKSRISILILLREFLIMINSVVVLRLRHYGPFSRG